TLPYTLSSTSNAFIVCTQTSSNTNSRNIATCDITSTSQLTFRADAGNTSTVIVNWTVVEFSEGVTVERQTLALPAGTSSGNVTLTNTFTCASSFVMLSGHRTTFGTNNATTDEIFLARANLGTSGTPCA